MAHTGYNWFIFSEKTGVKAGDYDRQDSTLNRSLLCPSCFFSAVAHHFTGEKWQATAVLMLICTMFMLKCIANIIYNQLGSVLAHFTF